MTHWVIIIHDKLSGLIMTAGNGAPSGFRYNFTMHVEIIKEQRLAGALNASYHTGDSQIIFQSYVPRGTQKIFFTQCFITNY